MKWDKYTIKTTTQAEDSVCGMLMELGINSIEIEDNVPISQEDKEKMYIDILPELPPDEGVGYVSFYLEEGQDSALLLNHISNGIERLKEFIEIGEGSIQLSQTEDSDWINNWKEFFKPFEIDNIIIKPTWENIENPENKLLIEIDPGTAFGTGKHETTQLCIEQLRKYMNEQTRLLDVGCGSGILSIISLKLGADFAVGIDIDENAVLASQENMKVNDIESSKYSILCGDLIKDENLQKKIGFEEFDVVVANILADIIIPLTPIVPRYLKKNGIYITSGIIKSKENDVVNAIQQAGLEVIEVLKQGDWVSIAAQKK
ncbi:50S ribosomal protein L11 methyltransferase [Anaerosacchariphilus polymeriproducens]|uniref:Ribosomal protein L11 methyltransferase n=1 Tax=Anaerosacchariphilus polymeriproducens TaxID=1812858 RepID=A0A371ASL9_9FIRM|nr:50S ribosomal protein L11 methyltransferase [Anaerosacchariphilus polymeriproducens]RDU22460.1 50S ribosomal protein L11 methyltransferase [Anaerosacchariphilus polymeriproducens]